MDKRLIQRARRERFAFVLEQYRQRHNLKIEQMALLLGVPKSTLKHWLRASRMPPSTKLPSICSKININHTLIFNDTSMRGLFYETKVLSFEAMQRRYLETRQEDPMSAFDYVTIAGALVMNQCTREALEADLTVKHDLFTSLRFSSINIRHLMLVISPKGHEGIGFTLLRGDDASPRIPWTYLTQASMDSLIEMLRSES